MGLTFAAEVWAAERPLAAALNEVARQSGLQLIYVSSLVAGRTAPEVPEGLPATETLRRLLADSGLSFEFINDNTVNIRRMPESHSPPAPAAPVIGLEEIVVTAEHGLALLQQTSLSIDVKDGERLRREGRTRVDEVLDGSAGINLQPGGGAGEVGIVIRGITASGGNPPGAGIAGTSIPILVDGMAQDRYEQVRGGILDIARVEVMRGPQNMNIGPEALAGAVSLVSNDPADQFQTSAHVDVGSYRLFNAEGMLNLPLSPTGSLRVAGSRETRNGYVSAGAGQANLSNFRVKYLYEPYTGLKAVFTAAYQHIGGNGVPGGALLARGRWVPYASNPVPLNGCVAASSLNITSGGCDPRFSRLLDGSTYRTRADPWNDGMPADAWPRTPFTDTDVTQLNATITGTTRIGVLTIAPSYQTSGFRANTSVREDPSIAQWFQERTTQFDTRLASLPSARAEWIFGAYFKSSDRTNAYRNASFPGGTGCPVSSSGDCFSWSKSKYNRQRTLSAFGSLAYPLTGTTRLIAGIRHTRDYKAAVSDARGFLGVPGSAAGPDSGYVWLPEYAGHWQATTYRAGLQVDVTRGSMIYATVATGYRPGNVNLITIPGAGFDEISTAVTPALRMTQATLGLKAGFLDKRLQLNVEMFAARLRNQNVAGALATQLPDAGQLAANNCGYPNYPSGLGPPLLVSAAADCAAIPNGSARADQRTQGLDLDVSARMTARDRLDFSMEYLSARYDADPLFGDGRRSVSADDLLAAIGPAQPARADAATHAVLLAQSLNTTLGNVRGATLQNAPRWSLDGSYQHTFASPNGTVITPKLNISYKSQYYSGGGGIQPILSGLSPLAFQPGFAVVNLFCTWSAIGRPLSVTAYVKNAANEVILLNYVGNYVTLDAPRTVGLTLQATL